MSLFSTLIIGNQALRAFQFALQTTSHNIANVNTPGFSRQRVTFSTETPDRIGRFIVGRGMNVDGIERLQDQFIEVQIRDEKAGLGQTQNLEKTYELMESVFQEPSDTGLAAALTDFWDAWHEVGNNPTDLSLRATLRSRSTHLADTFKRLNTGMSDLRKAINGDLITEVQELNSFGKRLDELNKQINGITFTGETPNDLFDERDHLLQQISEKANIGVFTKVDGQVNVNIQGINLVDETGFHEIQTVVRTGDPLGLVDLEWKESNLPVNMLSGSLKGHLDGRDTVIPNFLGQIDSLAQGMIQQINTLHRQGLGLDGAVQITGAKTFTGTLSANGSIGINGTNINLFTGDDLTSIVGRINAETGTTGVTASQSNNRLVLQPAVVNPQTVDVSADPNNILFDLGIVGDFFAGTNASDIRIADNIADDLRSIAASLSGAPGDNANARAISLIRDAFTMNSNTATFDDFYRTVVTELGTDTQAAININDNQGLLLRQLENIRESVSGVSLDEETANLLTFQRSYEIAARVIKTTDEMLEALINI